MVDLQVSKQSAEIRVRGLLGNQTRLSQVITALVDIDLVDSIFVDSIGL